MSILVGLHIKRVLEKEKKVVSKVSNRIYPVAAVMGTPIYPFIAYEVSGSSNLQTKDGAVDDTANVGVSVVAKSYEEAIMIANDVRYSFEGKSASYPELDVLDCTDVTYSDGYLEELCAFAVDLNFTFKTIDK